MDIGYFKPTVSQKATGTAPLPAPYRPTGVIVHPGQTIDSTRGGSPIPAIAYVHPFSKEFAAGIGLFAVSGMGVDYPPNIYLSKALTSYLNARLAPGIAYKVSEVVSVGVALNLMMAQLEYDVAAAFGQANHGKTNSFGYGATVGEKVTPAPMFGLGAAHETKSYFRDFSFGVPGGTDKLTFDQPQMATVGASLRPLESLLVAADLEWIDWSSTMGANLPKYSQSQPTTMPFNMNWKDQWVVKLGAQYKVLEKLALRAGFNYGKMPLDPSRAFENLVFPAVAENHFTAGAGYAVTPAIDLLLAGMYSPTAKISGTNAGPPPGGQLIASYSTQMSQYQIDLGATFKF